MQNVHKLIAWTALPFVLAACARQHKTSSFHVAIRSASPFCIVEVEDRTVSMNELLAIARLKAKAGLYAIIRSELPDTPYRCLGGAIYILQTAGFASVRYVGTTRSRPR